MNNVLVGISADEASTDSPGVPVATGLAAPGANCTMLEMATLTFDLTLGISSRKILIWKPLF